MSAVPKPKLTVAEYLARERTAEFKSEFYRGEMFAMAGASKQHVSAAVNMLGELHNRLKGSPCKVVSSDQRVKVSATGLYTYPDAAIVCGKGEYDPSDPNTLLNPVAIIEVLSPTTENYDRGAKFRQYQQIPSFKEYVLVSQDEPVVERFVRQPDDTWLLTVLTGLAGELVFATVPARIPLAEIFNGVEFPLTPTRGPVPG
jgi:Uma2 family endonuclease